MPKNHESAKPGLGTSIIEALARQMLARIKVADAKPGTTVSITHTQVAAGESGAKIIPLAKAV
jgi:two-component sensor histidine kinase